MSGDGSDDAAVPAAGVINQTMPLEVVAQQESTRSYFLAQTLESTHTVPIVSANLPLDKGTADEVAEPERPAEGDSSSEDEGGDDSDESDLDASDGAIVTPGVSAESTVIGSFEYRGITYAVEPGGESVAVVAADYAKLPEEFVDAQTIVLPSMVTSDGLDFYTVSRIADYAFVGINEGAAAAAQASQDADASSSTQAQAEAYAYEDDATPESSEDDDIIDDVDSESAEGDDVTADATIGITTVTIPASIVEIGDDAFTGADTLQYVVVSPDNPTYSQYDGCLYDADQTRLLLIPEGRLGAVWVPSTATTIPADVSSHCAFVTSFIVEPDSAASQLLQENDFYNANDKLIDIISLDDAGIDTFLAPYTAEYDTVVAFLGGDNGDMTLEDEVEAFVLEEEIASYALSDSEWEAAKAKGWTDRNYRDYVAEVVPAGTVVVDSLNSIITLESDISRQAIDDEEYYVIASGVLSSTGYAWWEITRTKKTDTLGTLRIHCEKGSVISSSAGSPWRTSNTNNIRRVVFDHVDAQSCASWFQNMPYLESVSFEGNRFPPSCTSISLMFAGCIRLHSFSANYTLGYSAVTDTSSCWSGTYSLAGLVEGFSLPPRNLATPINQFYPCISLCWYPDDMWAPGYTYNKTNDFINTHTDSASYVTAHVTAIGGKRPFFYGGNNAYLIASPTHTTNPEAYPVVRTMRNVSYIGWDARGGSFYAGSTPSFSFDYSKANYTFDTARAYPRPTDTNTPVTLPTLNGENGGPVVTPRKMKSDGSGEDVFLGWYKQVCVDEETQEYEWEFVCDGTGETIPNPGKTQVYYALWESDHVESNINFDLNHPDDATLEAPQEILKQGYGKELPESLLTSASTPDVPIVYMTDLTDAKAGYKFDGFWTHPSAGVKYYNADLTRATSGDSASPKRWRESGTTVILYAHWKYKIYLDLNTYNSDDQLVLNGYTTVSDKTGEATLSMPGLLSNLSGLQSVVQRDGSASTQANVNVEGYASSVSVDTIGTYITATYGAALQLPKVTERTGYDDTFSWGTERSEKGTVVATSLVGADANTGLVADDSLVGVPKIYDEGVTLYADWTGKAKTYDVRLVSQYADGSSYDFKSNPQTQDITVTYDAAVPTAGITKPVYQVNSTPTNLVFLGFTSRPNGAYSANSGAAMQGTQFVTITNDAAQTPTAMTDNSTNKVVDFRFTYDSDGIDLSDGKIVLYALWGYPQVDIEFDLQDASLNGELTPNKVSQKLDESGAPLFPGVYYQTLTTNDLMPDLGGLLNRHKNGRSGFVFNGFWTTKYTEAEGAKESIDGKDVEAVQYYDATGKCVYDPNEDGISTWDKTYGTKLYAHWQYRVYLDLNVFNSDGEAVLNADKSDFDVSAAWPSTRPSVVEQKDFATELQYKTGSVLVEDSAAVAQQYTLPRYGFTAIDGAPIQLPTLIDRKGYTDTRGWGITAGSFGAATDIQAVDTDNVKAAFRLTPADLVTVTSDTTSTGFDNKAYVLHANWRAEKKADGTYADALSGHPITYKVALHASYAGDTQEDSFQTTDNALDVQTFEVVYDSPIDVTDANAKLKPYATDPADETTINYVDATKDDNNALRNLVLQGFYTQKSTVAAHAGKAYVKVSGNRFSVADGAKQSGVIAFREVPTTGDTVDLYAWWTYNSMTVSFDLQGGRIDGLNDPSTFVIEGVVSHGDVPDIAAELGTVYDNAPVRSGYVFAGWWNTKYNERTAETIDGVTVNPKKYYDVTAADPDNVHDATDDGVWREYTNTTLYAHWKYTIAFDKQLDPASDLADVTLDAVKADNDAARISAVVMLTTGDARAAGASGTDLYGNEYVVTTAGDASKNGEVSDLAITAIAGAPVQLPQAQNRRMDVGNSSYEKIGYEASRDWRTDLKQPDELLAHDDGAAEQYFFTKLDDSWTGAGYADPAAVPCKLGKSTTADGGATLVLYAKWTPKPFYVKLNYSYETDGTAYTSTHGDDLLKVTYDQNDYQYVNASGVPIASRDEAWPDLLPADSSRTSATAQVAGETDPYDNLDFTGIATAPNAFKSNAGTGFVRQGDLYWSKNSTPEANAKNVIERFRAVRGEAGAGKAPGACIDTNNAANPFDMYVVWAQPTREITFDLSADAEDGTPTLAATTLERMKGDTVDAGGATDPAAKLAALADEVTGLTSRSNYVFGGFWTTPYQESLYTDEAGRKVQPVCYYTLQNGKLVAAKPDAGIEGGTGPWLSEHNASSVWLEDEATTLYAHWKYRIAFANDYTIPNTREKDMLQFGADTVGSYGGAQVSVPFQEVDAAGYADANGYVTLNAPLNLPVDQNSQGYNAIGRIRDFGKAAGYDLTGRGPTGYEFAGWSLDAGTDGVKTIVPGLNAAGELTDAMALAPQQRGLTTLYAQWTALPFTIEFDYYPDNLYADTITDHSVNEAATGRGTRSVTVLYDQSLKTATGDDTVSANGAITPPTLYGFEFLGYYATNDGKVEANGDVTGAGRRFYNAPLPQDAGTATDDGLSQPNDGAWFTSELSVVNGKGSTKLYAYYQQKEFTLHFSTWDSEDGTLQEPTGNVESQQHYDQKWHYGDKLRVVEGDAYQASGTADLGSGFPVSSTDTFTRRGYTFTGWYFYPAENDPQYVGESENAKAARAELHANPANRVYVFRCDATNLADVKRFPGVYTYDAASGQWVQSSVTTWRTSDLFDAEQNYTLYAGWEPKDYEVTFKARCPETTINDEVKTFSYGQVLQPTVDLTQVGELGKPYTFIGWNTQPDAKSTTKTGWLFDKTNYVQGGDDTTDNPALSIMDPTRGGVFMPNDTPRGITYYGIWEEPGEHRVVLFSGPHGTLKQGSTELAYANSIGYRYRLGVSDISKANLNDSYGLTLSEDTGYRFVGWAELSPAQLGVSGYDDLPATGGIDAFAQGLVNGGVNDIAVNTTHYFPNSYNASDKQETYVNPYTNAKPGFRDIYLIAVYELINDYLITLDLGDAATYSDKKDNIELGARIVDSVFQPTENASMPDELLYAYGFDVTKGDFALPEPVSGMHDFQGWELLGSDGAWTLVGKDVRIDVKDYADAALNDEAMAKRTYRAVWTPKQFTIRFTDVNRNIPVEMDDVVYTGMTYGETFKLPYPATRETGYPFSYWRLVCDDGYFVGRFTEGTEFDLRELLYAMRMGESYQGVYMGEVTMIDNEIVFDSVWGDTISVEVPVQALIKVDWDTGDILTQSGLSLKTRNRTDDIKVVSLRHDRLTTDAEHDESGAHLFGDEAGKVYLSVHTGMVAEDGAESGLFFKRNVDAATGRVLSGVVEQYDPLLIDLARDAIIMENYPFAVGEDANAYKPVGASFDLYDATQTLTSEYGFRVFNQTDKGALPVRFSLLFAGGAKPSDFAGLTALGHESTASIPVAQLHYTVQKAN